MRFITTIFWLCLAPLFASAAEIPVGVTKTIGLAGENAAEIRQAWEKCPAEQRSGMEFLLTHMPSRDATALNADYLLENTNLAYQARAKMPWGKDIPEEIFFNDVLPYATLDESRDDWRADFFRRFSAIVGEASTASEALDKINAAIEKELGVQYNTKRRAPNQGPAESMKLTMASCSGLSILLADALRSVCIPCRIVGTAMWTTKEGNHNWNEVWLPEHKSWKFTEYNPDPKGLDHGWLVADAARAIPGSVAHGVYATSWKKTSHHFPMVWNFEDTSVPSEDVTQRYITLGADSIPKPGQCELRIDAVATQADGSKQRRAIAVEVRQFDVVVAKGTTPSATADMNQFLTIPVPQGVRYQVVAVEKNTAQPQESQSIALTAEDKSLRVSLNIAP
ncbi:MAG: hypothetical protein B9S37_11120 [Verrucomicrobiia bacterium Tous-C3TDCM]|nr:MAG: hypothetical protein B9S37_11120 [Verrucomicrobiae bacterium Tous-C3TDCM]PAZ05677.1 MAG: hypothetical protein CAK88_06645 [Verrucomicrobiae bacterium AMD-G2]